MNAPKNKPKITCPERLETLSELEEAEDIHEAQKALKEIQIKGSISLQKMKALLKIKAN